MTVVTRLDLRLNVTDKDRITRAAELRGMALSAFVRDAVPRMAHAFPWLTGYATSSTFTR